MTAKQIYLVAYDYGQGARWAYVRAASPAEIQAAVPELTVVPERPGWMTDSFVKKLLDRIVDLDQPTGFIKTLIEEQEQEQEQPQHE